MKKLKRTLAKELELEFILNNKAQYKRRFQMNFPRTYQGTDRSVVYLRKNITPPS